MTADNLLLLLVIVVFHISSDAGHQVIATFKEGFSSVIAPMKRVGPRYPVAAPAEFFPRDLTEGHQRDGVRRWRGISSGHGDNIVSSLAHREHEILCCKGGLADEEGVETVVNNESRVHSQGTAEELLMLLT